MTEATSNHLLRLSLGVEDDELMLAEYDPPELSASQNEKLYFVSPSQKGRAPQIDLNGPLAREKCRFAFELMSNVVSQFCKAYRRQ
jgi:hypothetical protein